MSNKNDEIIIDDESLEEYDNSEYSYASNEESEDDESYINDENDENDDDDDDDEDDEEDEDDDEEDDDEEYDDEEEDDEEYDYDEEDDDEYDDEYDDEDDDDDGDDDNELENEEVDVNTKLNSSWVLWYHHEKNNWKINGYRKIYKIDTIKDFWELYKNFDRIGGINNQHFFLMREGIEPIWEDEANKQGGCWSFKKMENESAEIWEDLTIRIVGETLLEDNSEINGLSICLKRQSNSVIKIWNKNSKNNCKSLIHKDILNKYGKEILYIAHIPEF